MYASVRRYEGINPDSVDEIVRQVGESFVPSISEGSGFVAYFLLDTGNGAIATVSVFEDEAGAEKSNRTAAEFLKETLAAFVLNPPQIMAGEVRVHKIA
ncbi:MAG TPA: hypothetical protein VEG60_30590 [Candidatus Binatia bacterium]|nr:hypothetical protein [Candidatus Binatia bacterium]